MEREFASVCMVSPQTTPVFYRLLSKNVKAYAQETWPKSVKVVWEGSE